jgi:hypothetical protein
MWLCGFAILVQCSIGGEGQKMCFDQNSGGSVPFRSVNGTVSKGKRVWFVGILSM